MKTLYLLVFIKLFFLSAFGQNASWNYDAQTGSLGATYSWIDCSGGTSIVSGDDAQASFSWPFEFQFYDDVYTTSNSLSVCSNGFIRLDGTASTSYADAQNYTLSSTATSFGQIIALAMYDSNLTGTGTYCNYLVSGSSPNRILTVEYNNLQIDYNDGLYANVEVSFYETSNKIVLKLGTDNITASTVDMGIHSGVSGYFNKWGNLETSSNNVWIEYSPPPNPTADFIVDNTTPAVGQTVTFTNFSFGSPTPSYLWSFNPSTISYVGSTSSTSENPQVQFNSGGYYEVTLYVQNSNGNDTELKSNYILAGSPGNWTGTTSSTWTTSSNWENLSVPGSSDNVTIPSSAGNWPTYTGDLTIGTICGNITLAGSSELTVTGNLTIDIGQSLICSAGATIKVGGNWANNGDLIEGSGTIELNGSAAASIDRQEATITYETGGKADNTGGGGYYSGDMYLIFDADEAFTLISVKVYANGAGDRTISLQNSGGATLQTTTVNIADGEQTVTLNFDVPVGNDMLLRIPSGTRNLYRNNSGVSYPYSIGTNLGEVTTSSAGTTYYYFFYDWQVSTAELASGVETFNNLNITKTTNHVSTSCDVDVNNDLNINAGAAFSVSSGDELDVTGNFTIESTLTNSGSFINEGTYSGVLTYKRYMRASPGVHLFGSPVSGQTVSGFISSNPTKVNSSRLWAWEEATASWPLPTGSFISGEGYDMGAMIAAQVDFTGTVVSSASFTASAPWESYAWDTDHYTYTFATGRDESTNWGGGGWNLLANPFPSALDITDGSIGFLTVNDASFDPSYKAIYTYRDDGTGYEYIGAAVPGYSSSGETHIQAGQGFYVLTDGNGKIFNFNANMREHNSVDYKSGKEETPWPGIQLRVRYGEKSSSTLIVFNDEMTAGLDPGYDIGQLSNNPEVDIFTHLAQNQEGIDFTRQALPMTDIEGVEIPVGLYSTNGGEVTFSAEIIPLEGYKFQLEDQEKNTFTNLENDTHTATIPANTYSTGRFYVRAIKTTGIDPIQYDKLLVDIWSFNHSVYIAGEVSDQALASIWSLNGQKILDFSLSNNQVKKLSVPGYLRGIFLVKVIDRKKTTIRMVWF